MGKDGVRCGAAKYTMRATRGLPALPPSRSSRTCRLLLWHGAWHGAWHVQAWPGLGALTLADSFTLTQREKWDGLH